ncbi:MAG: hypothetical protein M3Y07_05605 [Acidobacteriota bacterium]|nr:hypothetical protein [Acidobacteriota bacterium]
MYRFLLPLWLLILPCAAQNPADLFKKAPPDVDQALRDRITKFYQYHVDGKFRQAEQLVAEESKDGFYAANKPNITQFRIDRIEYSDDFTKAKATIVGKMVIMIMGFGDKPLDVPFPSYWKLENGQWCWYINYDAARNTPFGRAPEKSGAEAPADPRAMMATAPDLHSILSGVKADKGAVTLNGVGSADTVTITNNLKGTVTVKPERSDYPGLEIRLDKSTLKAGEKAVVTFRSSGAGKAVSGPVHMPVYLVVQPTNQTIAVRVTFTK